MTPWEKHASCQSGPLGIGIGIGIGHDDRPRYWSIGWTSGISAPYTTYTERPQAVTIPRCALVCRSRG